MIITDTFIYGFQVLGGATLAGLVVYAVLLAVMRRLARERGSVFARSFLRYSSRPLLLVVLLIPLFIASPALPLSPDETDTLRHILSLALIGAGIWFFSNLSLVANDVVLARYPIDVKDNLRARTIYTQFRVLRSVAVTAVILLGIGTGLMTFEPVRVLGAGFMASAGIAAIVAGFAAAPLLTNLLAGLQIALTEPIHLDDVVIVEGEWGRVEEITLTYVVVRIWDERRLVVPITYFIQNPFQNWTRTSANLLGTVYLYMDYTVPTNEVRQEAHRILQTTPLWDGRVWSLQVTNATERTLELRALMSAGDSSALWDLRCMMREQLIQFLQSRYPLALPRVRAEMDGRLSAFEA